MDQLLLVTLSNAVTATVIALGIALLSWKLRRPAVLHLLWLVVLLRLLAPPLLDFGVLPAVAGTTEVGAAALRAVSAEAAANIASAAEERPAVRIALGLWLLGSIAIGTLIVVRTRRFRRVLRDALPADSDLAARVAEMAERVGCPKPPRVVVVDRAVSPMIWSALAQPVLVLPHSLLGHLTPLQLDTIVAHELAHLRRGDHRVRWMELIAIVLFWWNPTTWWACRGIRLAEEECCDAIVLRALPDRVRDYASGLVESVRQLTDPDPWPLDMASPLRRTATIERRIAAMLNPRNQKPLSVPLRALLVLTVAAALGLTPVLRARAATLQDEDLPMASISMELQEAEIGEVLAAFADFAEMEILTEPGVRAKVTIKVEDEPMALLFKRILQENGLTYTIEDGRIIVRKAAEHELEEVVKEPSADDDSVSRYVDGGPLTKPIKLDGPAPAYPEAAKKDGVTGVVVLDAVIGTDGRIARLEIVRSNDERLTEAATEAVADWTFEPATLHGEPVAVYYTLTVRFALE